MNQPIPISPDDLHHALLQAFFWDYIDRGTSPGDTPLFTSGNKLAHIVVRQFQLSEEAARTAVEIARKEVEL